MRILPAETAPQKALGIADSTMLFKEDTLRSGKGRCVSDLVDVLVNKSADAIDTLQGLGLDLSNITQCGKGNSSTYLFRTGE